MAIINSVTIGRGRGSIGNVTLRLRGGDTIASQKQSKGSQRLGTYAQVMQRIRLAPVVTAYRRINSAEGGNGAVLQKGFPALATGRTSTYNAFVKRNIERVGVYLSKEDATRGLLVPAPYQVSEGRLSAPRLTVVIGDDYGEKHAFAPMFGYAEIESETRLTDNPAVYGVDLGDTITLISIVWAGSADGSYIADPNAVKVETEQIVCNNSGVDAPWSLYNSETGDSFLKLGSDGLWSAHLFIRGRAGANGYEVSTGVFDISNTNCQFYADYSGANALAAAIASYGFRINPYLQADGSN